MVFTQIRGRVKLDQDSRIGGSTENVITACEIER